VRSSNALSWRSERCARGRTGGAGRELATHPTGSGRRSGCLDPGTHQARRSRQHGPSCACSALPTEIPGVRTRRRRQNKIHSVYMLQRKIRTRRLLCEYCFPVTATIPPAQSGAKLREYQFLRPLGLRGELYARHTAVKLAVSERHILRTVAGYLVCGQSECDLFRAGCNWSSIPGALAGLAPERSVSRRT